MKYMTFLALTLSLPAKADFDQYWQNQQRVQQMEELQQKQFFNQQQLQFNEQQFQQQQQRQFLQDQQAQQRLNDSLHPNPFYPNIVHRQRLW